MMTDPEPVLDPPVTRTSSEPLPEEIPYTFGDGDPVSGYEREDDAYHDLGGLARPDAYFGAKEFDCPNCQAAKGKKCKVWVERTEKWAVRKMPCVARIRLATEAGLL